MLKAGAARTEITPFWGVELAGWGYYLQRCWREIADPLFATAIAFENQEAAVIVSLDLMVADEAFCRQVAKGIAEVTGVAAESILVACTHSHNAPACGGLLGVGETDPDYRRFAARQAITAGVLAWRSRRPACTATSDCSVPGLQFNRTRDDGVVDSQLTLLRVDGLNGEPIAAIVNFAAHPTVETELQPFAVSGDAPGRVRSGLEETEPGRLVAYLQGACGDVNFLREFQNETRRAEPAFALTTAASELSQSATRDEDTTVAVGHANVRLPTRRWTQGELLEDREEAERRITNQDTSGWRETIGRAMTNRPDDMVARHGGDEWKAVEAMCRFNLAWTTKMLDDYTTRATELVTTVQAIRIGRWCCVSNASEFFSPFAIELRERLGGPLAISCYSGGRIGYLPDAHDIERKSYAAWQSPKYCDQFPFVANSGNVMTDAMAAEVQKVRAIR